MKRREAPLTKVPLVILAKRHFPWLRRDRIILPTLMPLLPGKPPGGVTRLPCDSAGSTAGSAGPCTRTRSTDWYRARQNREGRVVHLLQCGESRLFIAASCI